MASKSVPYLLELDSGIAQWQKHWARTQILNRRHIRPPLWVGAPARLRLRRSVEWDSQVSK